MDAQRLLESALSNGEQLVTDAGVLQEICHRYVAIGRREAIQPAFDAILAAVDEVLPIERVDVEQARDILLRYHGLSARGCCRPDRRRGSSGCDSIVAAPNGFTPPPHHRGGRSCICTVERS